MTGDASASTSSPGNGGAIAAAIVSEYAASAHCAQDESDTACDGRGGRRETDIGESPIAYIQRRIQDIVAHNREPRRPP